jgi:hypothetical protein
VAAKHRWRGPVFVIIGIVVVAGIGITVGLPKLEAAARAEAVRDAFFAALQRGDVDGAYTMLSTRRRSEMPRAAFDRLTDHPAFRKPSGSEFFQPVQTRYQRVPGVCAKGWLAVDGAQWKVELHMVDENGIKVHSIALAAPAQAQPEFLLWECGYSEGMMPGYEGPARLTPPIDRPAP